MPRATRSSTARANGDIVNHEPQQLSSPPATPDISKVTKKSSSKGRSNTRKNGNVKEEVPSTPANSSRKRSRKPIKQEEGDVNDLPHNLGTALPTPGIDESEDLSSTRPKKRSKRSDPSEKIDPEVKVEEEDVKPTPSKKTPKKANYGLTPGVSPYPDFLRPTPEECEEVVRVLEKKHGKVVVPEAIPPPSLDVAGCGEVPSVLDALVRTRLSANTTNKNSSTAFQGLVSRFGTLKEGIGKGSVDWDAVRRAPNHEVFKAIERGGLAKIKSKDIQEILQMAYEENQERRNALNSSSDDPAGADHEPESEKQEEIAKAKQNIISLDHLHLLSTNEAIEKMLSFPGIGPKTASCVALFCLQRPSFAVDTHVFRLCQYLGWVPKSVKKGEPKVDRNTTYSHCDARIPDQFKYPLHQLLIKHGKVCPRCRAITGTSSANWEEGCPIEHLVKRHGSKKGGSSAVARKKAKDAAEEGTEDEDGGADVSLEAGEDEEE
ncbi:putative DNA glycosylase [Pseudocercospora fuligena]|uniref:Putative DNA glycosylase n=1 Tax=Pseudocercospora fuligena TaxID=685502 RepID=A0A8H6RPB8_9PEZI|nr:putative DNA glycosylase [Pseudocercospora fuligena]